MDARRRFFRRHFGEGNESGWPVVRLPLDDEDVLLYSHLDIAPDTPYRSHITVWASFDGARTWPVKRLVYRGPSGYSMLAAGRPGKPGQDWIYLMFEGYPETDRGKRPWREQDQYLARFNLAWILGGEPTGDGSIPHSLLDRHAPSAP